MATNYRNGSALLCPSDQIIVISYICTPLHTFRGLSVAQSVKNCLQCKRPRCEPRVGKIPWPRKWQSTPGSLPERSHGQRSLAARVHGIERTEHDLAINHQVFRSLSAPLTLGFLLPIGKWRSFHPIFNRSDVANPAASKLEFLLVEPSQNM